MSVSRTGLWRDLQLHGDGFQSGLLQPGKSLCFHTDRYCMLNFLLALRKIECKYYTYIYTCFKILVLTKIILIAC